MKRITIGLLVVLFLYGCDSSQDIITESSSSPAAETIEHQPPSQPVPLWYLLTEEGGAFLPFQEINHRIPTDNDSLLPWVGQIRTVNLIPSNGTILAGINGWGLLEISNQLNPEIKLIPMIHALNRTMGGLFTAGKDVLIHIYGDSVFTSSSQVAQPPIYLMNEDGDISPRPGRESLWNDGWELVDFLIFSDYWMEQWKLSRGEKVEFKYLRVVPDKDGDEVQTMSKEAFRTLYRPASLRDVKASIEEDWREMDIISDENSIVELVFPRGNGVPSRVRVFSPPIESVIGFHQYPSIESYDGGGLIVLLSDRNELRTSAGPIVLPDLPGSCKYTDFADFGRWWIISWEESYFTDVGKAGLLFLPKE